MFGIKVLLTLILLVVSAVCGIYASSFLEEGSSEKVLLFLSTSIAIFALMFINIIMKM